MQCVRKFECTKMFTGARVQGLIHSHTAALCLIHHSRFPSKYGNILSFILIVKQAHTMIQNVQIIPTGVPVGVV